MKHSPIMSLSSSLVSIIINDGLHDIEHNINQYGVARNIVSTIQLFRTYESFNEEIKVGFIPTDKYDYGFNRSNILFKACSGGHKHVIDYFLSNGYEDFTDGLEGAVVSNNKKLIDFFMTKPVDIHWALFRAIEKNHTDLIKFFMSKCVLTLGILNLLLKAAAIANNIPLIEELITKGAFSWSDGLSGAVENGDPLVIQYFLKKIDHITPEVVVGAIRGGHKDLVIRFSKNHTTAYSQNRFMGCAAMKGNIELVKYFIAKGANDWQIGHQMAVRGGHRKTILFFEQKIKEYEDTINVYEGSMDKN